MLDKVNLSRIISESFEINKKGSLRKLEEKIEDELRPYSFLHSHNPPRGDNCSETTVYDLPSINSIVQIDRYEEIIQADQETHKIRVSKLEIDFNYPRNTNLIDINYIKNIFLKNGMKKIKN